MNPPHFKLPPGPHFIVQQLLSVKFVGYGAFVGCIHVGGGMLGVRLPLWATISCSAAAVPVIAFAQSELQYWKDAKVAESLGARLAPKVPYKWPMGADLIAALSRAFESGYLGVPFN